MTEWHARYGGRGVMIYWHVERKAACIYSQLKRCSSSEVAAMIEGVLRHYPRKLGAARSIMRQLFQGEVQFPMAESVPNVGLGPKSPMTGHSQE